MTFLSSEELREFNEKGYIIIKGLLLVEELAAVFQENGDEKHLNQHRYGRKDSQGNVSQISLWNHPADNIYGNIARSKKVVNRCEEILGEEVYHWHTKMMLKEAKTGGAWEWHQDYGYWYNNGCLTPNLISCMMGINESTIENGCLQVLEGSHQLGRIEHGVSGDQVGADLERVAEAEKRYKRVYVELKPGDALFFHSNLLHTSSPNRSEKPRLVLICCYNAKSNSPYKENSHHPHYTPIDKLEDEEVLLSTPKQKV